MLQLHDFCRHCKAWENDEARPQWARPRPGTRGWSFPGIGGGFATVLSWGGQKAGSCDFGRVGPLKVCAVGGDVAPGCRFRVRPDFPSPGAAGARKVPNFPLPFADFYPNLT